MVSHVLRWQARSTSAHIHNVEEEPAVASDSWMGTCCARSW